MENPSRSTISNIRRTQSLSGLTYTVWTSTNLTDWSANTNASQTTTTIPGTDHESVEVTLGPPFLNLDHQFVRIQAR